MAHRGYARVLAEHTYVHRMRTLLQFTTERIPGWPPSNESQDVCQELPPELAHDVSALVRRLNLPADVGFDDLVWAVRQQNGRLTGLETALLFLDEWKKMYN
jgi:spore maturation protein CgeB